jgi:hypothetical protein
MSHAAGRGHPWWRDAETIATLASVTLWTLPVLAMAGWILHRRRQGQAGDDPDGRRFAR